MKVEFVASALIIVAFLVGRFVEKVKFANQIVKYLNKKGKFLPEPKSTEELGGHLSEILNGKM